MTIPAYQCSCPAKVMLAGEYAVLEGGVAVMAALDRRAIALRGRRNRFSGPFLAAARALLAERFGPKSEAVQCIDHTKVDTNSFRDGRTKLGVGSSAASVVAAVGLALYYQQESIPDESEVFELALQAHGDAQAKKRARGSGADVATSCAGGVLLFEAGGEGSSPRFSHLDEDHALGDPDLHWVFPWPRLPASTTKLVQQVRTFRERNPLAYSKRMLDIGQAGRTLANAKSATSAISAVSYGYAAISALSAETGAPLVLPIHHQMAERAEALGGGCKPTGAGGGDLAFALFPSAQAAEEFTHFLKAEGIAHPKLRVDPEGVRFAPTRSTMK